MADLDNIHATRHWRNLRHHIQVGAERVFKLKKKLRQQAWLAVPRQQKRTEIRLTRTLKQGGIRKEATVVSKEKEAIAASRKTLSAARQAWILQKEEYAAGQQWKAEGKPVAWSCALFPKEAFWAQDIFAFFPEQFSALFSARRLGGSRDLDVPTYLTHYCQIVEAVGHPDYLCGYCHTGWAMSSRV